MGTIEERIVHLEVSLSKLTADNDALRQTVQIHETTTEELRGALTQAREYTKTLEYATLNECMCER